MHQLTRAFLGSIFVLMLSAGGMTSCAGKGSAKPDGAKGPPSVDAIARKAGSPPAAAKRPVTNEYHGVKVVDDYLWLENWDSPEVKAWSEAQNAYARSVLDGLANVESIRARVTEIMSAKSIRYSSLAARGERVFALKNEPPKQQPFIVVMGSSLDAGSERVLVDPNAIDTTGGTAIDWMRPSPDGSLLAVSLSKGGSEAGDVHIYDADSGKQVGEVVERVQGGTAGGDLAWTPDSKGFFYTRYPRAGERDASEMNFWVQVYFHRIGTPPEKDRYEIGKDFPRIAEVVLESDEHGRVLASVQNGDGGEFQHFLRAGGASRADGPSQWAKITSYEDRIVQATFGPDIDGTGTLYLVSRKDAPRGKLVRLNIGEDGAPEPLGAARTIVPEGSDTIVDEFFDAGNMAITPSRIYLTYQLGGPSELRVFDHRGVRQSGPQQLPIGDSGGVSRLAEETVAFASVSYIEPFDWYRFEPGKGKTTRLHLGAPPPVSFAECEVVRDFAVSKDGTKIPVNIVRKKGIVLDGSHPCLVTAYGGYGVNITPNYRPVLMTLLERGFVWAEANIRGGGEYGEAWHRQGNLLNKQNVFDDFAAACRHMISSKYTTSDRLAIMGGSNGGLLMGATFTQHPELARAVVSSVGIYDMLRVELSPNGAFNITEFGTVKDKAQFQALLAYSPYHHVQDNGAYPAILFLTGANDPRVDPMQSRKMTARLQAAQKGRGLVLLRTSANSGHGIGTALAEQIEQRVDIYSFLCDQLGAGAGGPSPR